MAAGCPCGCPDWIYLLDVLAGGCCMVRCGAVRRLCCGARSCGLRCAAQPRPALGMSSASSPAYSSTISLLGAGSGPAIHSQAHPISNPDTCHLCAHNQRYGVGSHAIPGANRCGSDSSDSVQQQVLLCYPEASASRPVPGEPLSTP